MKVEDLPRFFGTRIKMNGFQGFDHGSEVMKT
jgi:hypothetical protein